MAGCGGWVVDVVGGWMVAGDEGGGGMLVSMGEDAPEDSQLVGEGMGVVDLAGLMSMLNCLSTIFRTA